MLLKQRSRDAELLWARERRFYLRDLNDNVIANMICSKRRAIVLYQVPIEDSDLWYCGRVLTEVQS